MARAEMGVGFGGMRLKVDAKNTTGYVSPCLQNALRTNISAPHQRHVSPQSVVGTSYLRTTKVGDSLSPSLPFSPSNSQIPRAPSTTEASLYVPSIPRSSSFCSHGRQSHRAGRARAALERDARRGETPNSRRSGVLLHHRGPRNQSPPLSSVQSGFYLSEPLARDSMAHASEHLTSGLVVCTTSCSPSLSHSTFMVIDPRSLPRPYFLMRDRQAATNCEKEDD